MLKDLFAELKLSFVRPVLVKRCKRYVLTPVKNQVGVNLVCQDNKVVAKHNPKSFSNSSRVWLYRLGCADCTT